MSTTNQPAAHGKAQLRRIAFSGFLGTTLEWYDFFIFGSMAALVFNKVFFPNFSSATGTLAAFATFGAGFVARPLGGIVFGHLGDRVGRKVSLVVTLTLMGGATFCMGVLPGYASIGAAAPIILVVLRLLQGVALGGEWSGAASLAIEHAPEGRRGYYGGWVQYGGVFGPALATVTVLVLNAGLSDAALFSWGWRIPFLLSGLLVVIGLFVRLKIDETPVFRTIKAAQETVRFPFLVAIRTQWRSILAVAGMHLTNSTIAYTVEVFLLSYATKDVGLDRTTVLLAMFIMQAIASVSALPLGALADRVRPASIYLVGTIGLFVVAAPMFWLIGTGTFVLIVAGFVLGKTIAITTYMVQAKLFTELFPADVRCSGTAIGLQGATVLAGATAPLVAAALMTWSGGNPMSVASYLMVIALISTAATLYARRKSRVNRAATGSSQEPATASGASS
ncbi:MFS transporter [Amycolatopsis jejuensis]|uniref:MFS transporter n=1 Tax=Amycolatopsis jejuensis TaxID=330084 RepID=UPI0012E01400|nr:MFS transporter [Amycolatopsis jejuensis]